MKVCFMIWERSKDNYWTNIEAMKPANGENLMRNGGKRKTKILTDSLERTGKWSVIPQVSTEAMSKN